MYIMSLSQLIKRSSIISIRPNKTVYNTRSVLSYQVHGIAYNSQQVQKNMIFFAVPGKHTNGIYFIADAIKNGAHVIVHEDAHLNPDDYEDVCIIRVRNIRETLSYAVSAWYHTKKLPIHIVGITGTDGKSSTVYFIHQMCDFMGMHSGYSSTFGHYVDDRDVDNNSRMSSPEALESHQFIHRMYEYGKRVAIFEATSHGLSHRTARLQHINFHSAVFTAVTHEHFDFHGDYEHYRADKGNIIEQLVSYHNPLSGTVQQPFIIVNYDDKEAYDYYTMRAGTIACYSYSLCNKDADIYVTDMRSSAYDTHFVVNYYTTINGEKQVHSCKTSLCIPGDFFVANMLAALLWMRHYTGQDIEELVRVLPHIISAPGRMHSINHGQDFACIIDYAHTPLSFEKILPLFRHYTKGTLHVVFGSAGERDVEKRALQGALAARYCDALYICDEDPRREDPLVIINDIIAGAQAEKEDIVIHCIPDRLRAIEAAVFAAVEDDTILFLGKGHEKSIIYADSVLNWSEYDAVYLALKKRAEHEQ